MRRGGLIAGRAARCGERPPKVAALGAVDALGGVADRQSACGPPRPSI